MKMDVGVDQIAFSVVIPTYNRGRLVVRAVESVLAQRQRPSQIIVVDDGSTDNTRQLISQMGSHVTYIYQENQGSAVARNNGIQHTNHPWVALLDSDDVWLENHLACMAEAIVATEGKAGYYFANTVCPDEKGGGLRWQGVGFEVDAPFVFNTDGAQWALLQPQPMMLQSTVFNKAAFLNAGGFLPRLRYRDDTHLFIKLGVSGPICAVNNVGTQMTSDDAPDNRLTLTYDNQLRGARMQVVMFDNLLKTVPWLAPMVKKELTRRLAFAHLSVARHTWRSGRYLTAVNQLIQCAKTQPAVFTGSVQRNLQKIRS